MENSESYAETSVFVKEVPVLKHNTPEVIEAKEKEIKNFESM